MNKEKALKIIQGYESSQPFETKNKAFFWNNEKEHLFNRVTLYLEAKQFLKNI